MEAFTTLTSTVAALPVSNIDTDIIFPARFLLHTEKRGLGKFAFYEWRFAGDGSENADFVFNRAPYRGAQILVAGDNFGCGSSREQAPWALRDFGLRCIISSSFGEIFYSNCFQNGILPVVVDAQQLADLQADATAGKSLTVDLPARRLVRQSGAEIRFEIADWRREAMINGWDEITTIINHESEQIAAFETKQRLLMPWLYKHGHTG